MSAPSNVYPVRDIEIYSNNILVFKDQRIQPYTTEQEGEIAEGLNRSICIVSSFFWSRFEQCGVNKKGGIPSFYINCSEGETSFAFSTRPELLEFNSDAACFPEVIAHEYMHGVIRWLNPLDVGGEAGALGESLADIFGVVFKRVMTKKKNWKIGSYRDLSKTIAFQDLETFTNNGPANDYGYVHYNSLVLSHGFYLIADAMKQEDPRHEILLKIWWTAFSRLEKDNLNFVKFAHETIAAAQEIGKEQWEKVVRRKWQYLQVVQ